MSLTKFALRSHRKQSNASIRAQLLPGFNEHDQIIPRKGLEAVALLSCLFPEGRPDRVFNLQEKRLETILQQA